MLKTIAKVLRVNLRQNDLIGRWGGEEILLICPDLDYEGARLLSERLESVVEQAEFQDVGRATISTGVATYQPGDAPNALILRADQAMYARKNLKRELTPDQNDAIPYSEAVPTAAIVIQPASPETDAVASELIYQSFPETADYLFGIGSRSKAKSALQKLFSKKGNRFSHEFTDLLHVQGEVFGLLLSYPGSQIEKLDAALFWQILSLFSLTDFIRFFQRAFQLRQIKDATADEFFINNIAVLPEYRGRGYGKALLDFAEQKARRQGLDKISLTVADDNHRAIHLYERVGYELVHSTIAKLTPPADGTMKFQKMAKRLN